MLRNIYVKRDESVFKSIEQFSLIISDQIGFRYCVFFLRNEILFFPMHSIHRYLFMIRF